MVGSLCLSLAHAGEPSVGFPPAVRGGTLTVPPDAVARAEAFRVELEALLATGDAAAASGRFGPSADSVEGWLDKVLPHLESPIRVEFEPVYPLGVGVVLDRIHLVSMPYPGGRAMWSRDKPTWLGPDEHGVWHLRELSSAPVGTSRLTAVRAEVVVEPRAEWLRADVWLTVRSDGADAFPFTLATRRPGGSGGFRVVEVTQDDAPCPFWVGRDQLVVAPARRADEVTLRVRYEGEAQQSDNDYVTADEVVLRSDGHWLPTLPDTLGVFDVTLRHPEGFRVFAQGAETPGGTDAGWVTTRWVIDGEDGFTVYGAPSYVTQTGEVQGTEVLTAVWPRDADRLAELSSAVSSSVTRLSDALGPYPYPTVRVVESGRNDGRSGYGPVSNISLGWRSIRDGEVPREFVTHELAHGWWGGKVPSAAAALANGQWNESFAEYSSAWGLDPVGARDLRQKWSTGYAALDASADRPMSKVGTLSAKWDLHHAVTYEKGALVLTALEDRLGRTKMLSFLNAFVRDRAGQASTWTDVLAVLEREAGAEDAAWLRKWIESVGAPAFRVEGLTRSGARLTGSVVQGESDFAGSVELGFYGGTELLGTTWVDFGPGATPFTVRAPRSTDRVALDPNHRLPRRAPLVVEARLEP